MATHERLATTSGFIQVIVISTTLGNVTQPITASTMGTNWPPAYERPRPRHRPRLSDLADVLHEFCAAAKPRRPPPVPLELRLVDVVETRDIEASAKPPLVPHRRRPCEGRYCSVQA